MLFLDVVFFDPIDSMLFSPYIYIVLFAVAVLVFGTMIVTALVQRCRKKKKEKESEK